MQNSIVTQPASIQDNVAQPVNSVPLAARARQVVVTGGAGFLGSHLCDRLMAEGHEVVCLDNFMTGRVGNVEHLRHSARFILMKQDVIIPFPAEATEIYNLACPASPVDYQADSVRTAKTCFLGALNCLQLACASDATVLQASTSEVYGDPLVHPQTEGYFGNVNPIGPRACYDEGKRIAETLFFDHSRQFGTKIRVARIFNTYGPRMRPDDGRVVSNFIVQALRGRDLTIYGNGDQTRSFCYVDDLIEGFLRLMRAPGAAVGPVNLGNPGEFTVRELADLVIALTGSRSKITHRPLPQDDPRQRRPDITEAARLLNWRPTVALAEGLTKTIAYFEEKLAAGRSRVEELVA